MSDKKYINLTIVDPGNDKTIFFYKGPVDIEKLLLKIREEIHDD